MKAQQVELERQLTEQKREAEQEINCMLLLKKERKKERNIFFSNF